MSKTTDLLELGIALSTANSRLHPSVRLDDERLSIVGSVLLSASASVWRVNVATCDGSLSSEQRSRKVSVIKERFWRRIKAMKAYNLFRYDIRWGTDPRGASLVVLNSGAEGAATDSPAIDPLLTFLTDDLWPVNTWTRDGFLIPDGRR